MGYRLGDEAPEVTVRLAMSWEHLSVFVQLLQAQLAGYQAEVGPLPDLSKLGVQREEP